MRNEVAGQNTEKSDLTKTISRTIYDELGIQRVVNAHGAVTLLGATSLSPRVMNAVEYANNNYASMHELLDKAGAEIARILGSEAACITSGTTGGLVMSVAAAMAGTDPDRIARLPDTLGMRDRVVIQGPVRWLFERAVTQTGAKLVKAGSSSRCTVRDLEDELTESTAAIIHVAAPRKARPDDELLGLEQLVEVGQRHGIPVIVDAAGQIMPLEETFRWNARTGNLVCFGSKYHGGPNSAGYVTGNTDLIESVKAQGFISFDEAGQQGMHGGIGRAFKIDRAEIVAAVVSLQEWFDMDHRMWRRELKEQLSTIADAVKAIPGVETSWIGSVEDNDGSGIWLKVTVAESEPLHAQDIAEELASGDPAIWVAWARSRPNSFNLGSASPRCLFPGDEVIIAKRLAEVLTAKSPTQQTTYHPASLARNAVGVI